MKTYWVYMMTNWNNEVLYVGVTNSLERRVKEHQQKENTKSFTARYNCTKLVWYDSCSDVHEAISAEKKMKGWIRKKKNDLVEEMNPEWKDLSEEWD